MLKLLSNSAKFIHGQDIAVISVILFYLAYENNGTNTFKLGSVIYLF